ncbi:DinB family protein [Rubrolithibacter danxiaensis]|uniref:DinB family protein n=1 Tax=Rubrolithibacter danxiaensis TaxID=3390805 RepID=UPI003BF81FAC
MPSNPVEVWQRGPVPEITPLLQPVAHALLQAREEVEEKIRSFPTELLWVRPAGMASCGFHLQHLCGVIDRLFTYARNEKLSENQFAELKAEKDAIRGSTTAELLERFTRQVDSAIEQLKSTPETILTDYRPVGRAALPSTVIGLLFHAAEHTMRHLGQLIVTSGIVSEQQA